MWRLAVTPIFGFLFWNRIVKINHRLWNVPPSLAINPTILGMTRFRAWAAVAIFDIGFLLGWEEDGSGKLSWIPKRGWRFGRIQWGTKRKI